MKPTRTELNKIAKQRDDLLKAIEKYNEEMATVTQTVESMMQAMKELQQKICVHCGKYPFVKELQEEEESKPKKSNMHIDIVCGMEVNEEGPKSSYLGETYYFCSLDCKLEFDAAPDDYVEEVPLKEVEND